MRTLVFRRLAFLLVVFAILVFAGCKKKEEAAAVPAPEPAPAVAVGVSEVLLGSAIGPDKLVTEVKETFAPVDTIYASVTTDGPAPSVVLRAKWTYQDGQVVEEQTETIAPTGPAVTEFHVSKPDGWPKGNYKVEITLDGQPAATKEFRVE